MKNVVFYLKPQLVLFHFSDNYFVRGIHCNMLDACSKTIAPKYLVWLWLLIKLDPISIVIHKSSSKYHNVFTGVYSFSWCSWSNLWSSGLRNFIKLLNLLSACFLLIKWHIIKGKKKYNSKFCQHKLETRCINHRFLFFS